MSWYSTFREERIYLKCYYDQIFDNHFFSLDWQLVLEVQGVQVIASYDQGKWYFLALKNQ